MSLKTFTTRTAALTAVLCAGLVGSAWLESRIHNPADAPTAYALPAGDDGVPLAFVALDPYRTYDSRFGEPRPTKLTTDGYRTVFVGLVLLPDGSQSHEPSPIPDEADAVSFTITVTETESAGFAQVARPLETDGTTSNVNWTGPGHTVANSGVSRLEIADDGGLIVAVKVGGSPDASAHVIVDITGYYIPIPTA